MIRAGFAFHCHHNQLIECIYDFNKRVEYIKENKPPEEQSLRLRLFQLIPSDRIPAQDSVEWITYDKAWEAYKKVREAYDKAGEAYVKAEEAYLLKYSQELEELHKELCPDCPWDGKTIFTRKNENGEWY